MKAILFYGSAVVAGPAFLLLLLWLLDRLGR